MARMISLGRNEPAERRGSDHAQAVQERVVPLSITAVPGLERNIRWLAFEDDNWERMKDVGEEKIRFRTLTHDFACEPIPKVSPQLFRNDNASISPNIRSQWRNLLRRKKFRDQHGNHDHDTVLAE